MRSEFDGVVIEKQQVLCDAVNCHNLSIKGIGEFRSEVEADFVDISGEACFESYITCDKMTVRNRCVCKSSLLTTSLRIIGVMAVYGKLNSENSGAEHIHAQCRNTEFHQRRIAVKNSKKM